MMGMIPTRNVDNVTLYAMEGLVSNAFHAYTNVGRRAGELPS